MQIDSFLYSNIGGRTANEDSVGERRWEYGGMFVVADGLGGHKDGKLASQHVVDALTGIPEPGAEKNLADIFADQVERANASLLEKQKQLRSNMRTTVVALAVTEKQTVWAHVGDSRLYYIRKGSLLASTADHSVAYQKYKAGEITKNQIGQDEDQSSLLRAVGNASRHKPDVFTWEQELAPGDMFLLCSDGLWEYLQEEEIAVDSLKADSAQRFAELLLLRVMERLPAGNDNLSLIAVKIC